MPAGQEAGMPRGVQKFSWLPSFITNSLRACWLSSLPATKP